MRFPHDSMTQEEEVKDHLHPHWRTMLMPMIWTFLTILVLVVVLILLPGTLWGRAILVAIVTATIAGFIRLAAWPFVVWRTTHIVLTTERILLREGVLKRDQRDIPLARLNEVEFHQGLLDRALGSGTLVIASHGDHGEYRLRDIPHVVKTQVLINELIRGSGHRRGIDVTTLERKFEEFLAGSSPEQKDP